MGPRWFALVDSKGRPWVALLLALGFGLLAYINEAPQGNTIFTWLLALSGLSNFFTWGSICLAHIRFRYAWTKVNGRSLDELPFASQFGVWGSYIGLTLNILCLIATFYTSLWVSFSRSSLPRIKLTRFLAHWSIPQCSSLLRELPCRANRASLLLRLQTRHA
jgi:amino acid permease